MPRDRLNGANLPSPKLSEPIDENHTHNLSSENRLFVLEYFHAQDSSRPTSERDMRLCKHLVRLIPRRSHVTTVRTGRAVDDVAPPLTSPHSITLLLLMNR